MSTNEQRQQDNLEVECLLILTGTALAVLAACAIFVFSGMAITGLLP